MTQEMDAVWTFAVELACTGRYRTTQAIEWELFTLGYEAEIERLHATGKWGQLDAFCAAAAA